MTPVSLPELVLAVATLVTALVPLLRVLRQTRPGA